MTLTKCARIEEVNNGFVVGLGGTLRCSGCVYSICASSCLLSASLEQPVAVSSTSSVSSAFDAAAAAGDAAQSTCAGFDYDTTSTDCYFHTIKSICLPLTARSSGINTRLVTCTKAGNENNYHKHSCLSVPSPIDFHPRLFFLEYRN